MNLVSSASSPPRRRCSYARLFLAALAILGPTAAPSGLAAQERTSGAPLTFAAAVDAARRASPETRAAREAVAAAVARERQAGALPNPTFAYGREQTSRGGQSNAQDIAQVELPVEVSGQRAARQEAARLRREATEARLGITMATLEFETARAFVLVMLAERRLQLSEQSTAAASQAERVIDERLAAGDVSGYAARRLRLEAARYAAQRAEATLALRTARQALASQLGLTGMASEQLVLDPGPEPLRSTSLRDMQSVAGVGLDSLLGIAERRRHEVQAAVLDAAAALAEARVVARDRFPLPVISAGYKGERVASGSGLPTTGLTGFVAGLSVPLPVFDRRTGAVSAAQADARRVSAEGDVVRRRIAREVADAVDALRSAEAQRAALAPHVGEETRLALRAVQAAYAEGEITLAEWLDAVRAWQEAESTFATLDADVVVRRAALARAIGLPLFPTPTTDR